MGSSIRSFQVNGQSIRRYRIALRLSQAELAIKAGYSERLIRKAEASGALHMETITDLAEALSSERHAVVIEQLLSGTAHSGIAIRSNEQHGKKE